MQLKYRGIAYQASFVEDRADNSTQLGLSRRKSAKKEKSTKVSLRQPGEELIYRGVRYIK